MQLAKTMGAIPERINFAIPIDEARSMIRVAYPAGFTRRIAPPAAGISKYSPSPRTLLFSFWCPGKSKPQGNGPPRPAVAERASPEIFGGTNRQPVAMRPSLLAFVQAFIQSAGSDRLESAMQFYAPKVDYYDKGAVDADFIRKDIAELWRRWPRRDYQLVR